MSLEAITWALHHASPEGRNTVPTVATLTQYTRLSERSVHDALRTRTTWA